MSQIKIVKSYLGKGRSFRIVWAVREYVTYVMPGSDPDVTIYSTLGTWATETEAVKAASR